MIQFATDSFLYIRMFLLALLAMPELAGLWTVCMFNPVSFEVVFVACVLAGICRRKGEPNEA